MYCGTDNILWNIFYIQVECGEYSTKYYQSHKTPIWIWIMLCIYCYHFKIIIIIMMLFILQKWICKGQFSLPLPRVHVNIWIIQLFNGLNIQISIYTNLKIQIISSKYIYQFMWFVFLVPKSSIVVNGGVEHFGAFNIWSMTCNMPSFLIKPQNTGARSIMPYGKCTQISLISCVWQPQYMWY